MKMVSLVATAIHEHTWLLLVRAYKTAFVITVHPRQCCNDEPYAHTRTYTHTPTHVALLSVESGQGCIMFESVYHHPNESCQTSRKGRTPSSVILLVLSVLMDTMLLLVLMLPSVVMPMLLLLLMMTTLLPLPLLMILTTAMLLMATVVSILTTLMVVSAVIANDTDAIDGTDDAASLSVSFAVIVVDDHVCCCQPCHIVLLLSAPPLRLAPVTTPAPSIPMIGFSRGS